MNARLRRLRADESGLTLVELLVTMVIFSLLAVVVSAVFANTIKSVRYVSAKSSTTADTRIAMEAMSRSLRVALTPTGEPSAFVNANTNSVTFYASLARGVGQTADRPTRVTYDYVAATGCLRETQVPASLTGNPSKPFAWTAAGSSKCLIRTYSPPTFQYFDDGRLQQSDGTVINPLTVPSGGFSDTNNPTGRSTIISVQVSLNVQDPNVTDVKGVQARDRVTLTNVLAARTIGG